MILSVRLFQYKYGFWKADMLYIIIYLLSAFCERRLKTWQKEEKIQRAEF